MVASSDVAGGGVSPHAETTLTLVAYAVPEPGWSKIIPAFAATAGGQGRRGHHVLRRIGRPVPRRRRRQAADIVNFSVEPDITRLVKADKVAKDWNADATKGIPFGSVVSLVVRKGNPKNIKDWDDLLQPGLEVVTPEPAELRARRSGTCWRRTPPRATAARTRRPAWTSSTSW